MDRDATRSRPRHPPLRQRPRCFRFRTRRGVPRVRFLRHHRPRHRPVPDRWRVRSIQTILRSAARYQDEIPRAGHGRSARLHAVEDRNREGQRPSGPQGVLAHRPRVARRFAVPRALALHIGLPERFFDDKTNAGNSILRPIHYPPIETAGIPNVRAGAHEDINFITLLVGASAAGLELLTRAGEWLPITTTGDTVVVNIGDMLQRLTNHVYPSTTHRV